MVRQLYVRSQSYFGVKAASFELFAKFTPLNCQITQEVCTKFISEDSNSCSYYNSFCRRQLFLHSGMKMNLPEKPDFGKVRFPGKQKAVTRNSAQMLLKNPAETGTKGSLVIRLWQG